MSPIRAGFVYGLIAVAVAALTDLRSLYVNPEALPDWILTVLEQYRTSLAAAAYLFLGILAALRARPTHLDPGVPYRQLLVRDSALAATTVAVVVGVALLVITALNSTVFAGDIRDYAREAAPNIVAYSEKVAGRLDDPPPIPSAGEIEDDLQPPAPRDLGRSLFNLVLRALLIGTTGALVGALRGLAGGSRPGDAPTTPSTAKKPEDPSPGER